MVSRFSGSALGILVWFLAGGLAQGQGALLAASPALCRFLGDPTADLGEAAEAPLASASAFCAEGFAEAEAPAVRRLHGCWIVAGEQGVRALAADGRPVASKVLPELAQDQVCRALAVLPPGAGPVAFGAPLLAYCVTRRNPGPDPAAELFVLGADGSRKQLAPGTGGEAQPRRQPSALALDRDGNVFVAFSDGREILRIDLTGGVSRHAWLPDGDAGTQDPDGAAAAPAGILAMVLDPATGDLLVGDRCGLRKVSAAGIVTGTFVPGKGFEGTGAEAAEGPFTPCHLALRGRELFIVDGGRRELQVLHLDSGRRVTLLGRAGDGRARLGPVRFLDPALPAAEGAALGAIGALAIAPEGGCLLAVGNGLATLALPERPVTARSRTAGPAGPRRTARQEALAHFRTQQLAVRNHKKRQREVRRLAAMRPASGLPASGLPASGLPGRAGLRPRFTGLFCMTLLGLGALTDPAVLGALAQGLDWSPEAYAGLASRMDRQTGDGLAALDGLGPLCEAPLVSGRNLLPCTPAYRASVAAQMRAIHEQLAGLAVDPATLGAGECVPGEPRAQAETRIELAQSSQLARFDRLTADAGALWYDLSGIGHRFAAVGAGLLLGETLALASGSPPGSPAMLAGAVLGPIGHDLGAAGAGLRAVGSTYGRTSNTAFILRSRYQRWANSQVSALLNCTGAAAPRRGAGAVVAAPPPLASPFPAMQEALQWLEEGCALAARQGLRLPVCAPEAIQEFHQQNMTMGSAYRGLACLSAGVGVPGPCERGQAASSLDRSNAYAYLGEFAGEMGDTGYLAFIGGDSLGAAGEGLAAAGTAALLAGNATAATGLLTASNSLAVGGNVLFAVGYEFFRMAAVARSWLTRVTLEFNAERQAELDRAPAGPADLSTGAGPALAAGTAAPPIGSAASTPPAPAGGAIPPATLEAVATPVASASALEAAATPVASAAARPQPCPAWTWLRLDW